MEKVSCDAGIPGDEIAAVSLDLVNAATQRPRISNRASFTSMGVMPRSSYSVMAVVNEDGYLVPVCTAGDLLRGCKIFWQASED